MAISVSPSFTTFLKCVAGAFVVLFVVASPGLAGGLTSDCADATTLALDARLYSYAGLHEPVQQFRLELPAPGLVSVDVSTAGERETLARLSLSAEGCGAAAEATILEQAPAHLVLAVRTPGTLLFRVTPREPGLPLGPYGIVTAFVGARVVEETYSRRLEVADPFGEPTGDRVDVTRFHAVDFTAKSDPMEVDPDPGAQAGYVTKSDPMEVDPDPGAQAGYVTKSDPMEVDPDPGAQAGYVAKSDPMEVDPDPGATGSSKASPDLGLLASIVTLRPASSPEAHFESISPERSMVAVFERASFYRRACASRQGDDLHDGLGGLDDHGDTMGCATPVVLGKSVAGEIGNAGNGRAGHDDDIFELTLTELTSLDITTRGEADVFGMLYDRFGQQLAMDDDSAEGRNFHIATVLAPGRYFVRVAGAGGARGAYELAVMARGW